MSIKKCSVFCGSRTGKSPRYTKEARALGAALAQHNISLIYGGGKAGLMGSVADAALEAHGHVKGIIPRFLEAREVLHEGVTDLDVTDDMPSRKEELFAQADAYIILPGGFGTFDEFAEVLVNRQLGLHNKPIIILNCEDWANPLISTLHATVEQGFAEEDSHTLYTVVKSVSEVMDILLTTT